MRGFKTWLKVVPFFMLLVLICSSHVQAQTQYKFLEKRVDELEKELGKQKIEQKKLKLPEWLNRFTFKGDFRVRYEYKNAAGKDSRHRGRFRYRLSVDAKVIEPLKIGFGIASGGDDPRSTNQTFQDSFSSKNIRIDLAYADFRPIDEFGVIAGKFSNPIWRPTSQLWDSDIRPEGVALKILNYMQVAPVLQLYFVTGVFVVDEFSSDSDPLLIPIQGVAKFTFTPHIYWQISVDYYRSVNVQGKALDFSSSTNTLTPGEVLAFTYNTIGTSTELGFQQLSSIVPFAAIVGQFVTNPDPDEDKNGFIIGVKFGHKSVSKAQSWQVSYLYERLERDAWLDILPDSDFLNGETNVKGHKVQMAYAIIKHVSTGVSYFHTEAIDGDSAEDLFQLDLMFKF